MNSYQLVNRTKKFAIDVIKFFQKLPRTDEARIVGKQLLRSSTSVAANYRAACRARSRQEFYAKICIVVEEVDESLFWLELLKESGIGDTEVTEQFINEAQELVRIFSSTRKSTRDHLSKSVNQ